ncbi:MAG: transposase domain-containing protein [Eubacteriales bacterium]
MRAWPFADAPKGATANAILYTLAESAKADELNVYEYSKYLLTKIPELDHHNQPEFLDDLLLWSEQLPDDCKLK